MSDRPEIRVFDQYGRLVRLIRWLQEVEPVTLADRGLYNRKREKWLARFPQVEEAVPELETYQAIPTEKPLLLTVLVDDEGNLWAREYPASVAGRADLYDYGDPDAPFRENPGPDQEPERWRVFSPSGRFLGLVQVPAALALRAIQNGQIGAVWRDDLDVERVRFHRLVKE
jgi:hypothetical protein